MSSLRASALFRHPGIVLFTAAPAAFFFYLLLARSFTPLPFADDYHAVLQFTSGFVSAPSGFAKLQYLLAFRHNEYKLLFEEVIYILQYWVFGHVSFPSLVVAGNLFAVVMFLAVAAMVHPPTRSRFTLALLLVPIPFLIFQLQYATTLNWAMCALQNVAVLGFALFSFLLLSEASTAAFVGACVALFFAVCASGSGVLAGPVGMLLLVQQRRWRRLIVWTCLFGVLALAYSYRPAQPAPAAATTSATPAEHHGLPNPAYALSFMGSSAAGTTNYLPALALGTILLGVFALAIRKGYYRTNPAVFYSMLFIILTAGAVSVIRSELGIAQSLASRYRANSNLLVIFSWIFFVETWFKDDRIGRPAQMQRIAVIGTACFAILFCAASDSAGYHILKGRRDVIVWEIQRLEHPTEAAETAFTDDPIIQRQINAGLYRPDPDALEQADRLGVYHLPTLPPPR